jgi:hypothetical protein
MWENKRKGPKARRAKAGLKTDDEKRRDCPELSLADIQTLHLGFIAETEGKP